MKEQKTVIQKFFEDLGLTQVELSLKTKVPQSNISMDLKSNNGLKKCMKYASRLGMSEFEFKGIEHGCYIEGTAKVKR